jgi:hypothetical protein
VGDQSITILENCPIGTGLIWDSRTGAVTGIFNGVRRAVRFSGNSLVTIPVSVNDSTTMFKVNGTSINADSNWSIKYHYWYY